MSTLPDEIPTEYGADPDAPIGDDRDLAWPEEPVARIGSEPEPLACSCGERWLWTWYAPRGGRYPARWCAPPVNPCDRCRPDPAWTAEHELRARLRAADLPEPLWAYRLEQGYQMVQRGSERPDQLQARVRAQPGMLGVLASNLEALRRVRDWHPPRWLVLHGPPGTGKTTVLAAIGRRVLTARPDVVDGPTGPCPPGSRTIRRRSLPRVLYAHVPDLLRRELLKLRGLDPHPTVDVAKVGILLLDELGLTERPTEAELRLVERVVCYRHDRGLCTVAATNRTWPELTGTGRRAIYGQRVADRLRGAVGVGLGGPSWRAE